MKAVVIATILLLAGARAEATKIVFNYNPLTNTPEWSGIFSGTTIFNTVIGICANQLDCTYDNVIGGVTDPGGNSPFHGTVITHGFSGQMNFTPSVRFWATNNG